MVWVIIDKLDPHKACEYDDILVIVLNKCALELNPVLSNFYNKWYFTSSLLEIVFYLSCL